MPLLLLLLLILIFFLKRNPELRRIYFTAILAHLLILTAIYIFINPVFGGNDGNVYSAHAGSISLVVKGNKYRSATFFDKMGYFGSTGYGQYFSHGRIPAPAKYGVGYVTYIYSIFYAAYGFIPVYIHISNMLLHLLTGAIVFKICDMLFNRKTSIIALVLFLFNPVSLYYTTTLLKESLYFFAFYLSIYLAIFSVQKRNIIYFLLLIPSLLLIQLLKAMLLKPFLLVLAIYFAISFFSAKRLLFVFGPIMVVLFCLQFNSLDRKVTGLFYSAAQYNKGFYGTTHGGAYNYNLKKIGNYNISLNNNSGKIMYAANGWYHFVFEPIFSKNLTRGLFAYYPFKLIWVSLFISSLFGIFISSRYDNHYNRENILLVSFLFIIGSCVALSSGNVGTMLRHRDIISPVIFIYAAYFISIIYASTKNSKQLSDNLKMQQKDYPAEFLEP